MSAEHAKDVSSLISRGTWTHDHPLLARDLEALGLPIKIGVGAEERALLELYPQPRPAIPRRVLPRLARRAAGAPAGTRAAAPRGRSAAFCLGGLAVKGRSDGQNPSLRLQVP